VEDVVKASGCEDALGPPEQGPLIGRLDASACGLGHRAELSLELTCQDRGPTPLHALGAPFLPESLGKSAHRIGLIAVLTLIALPLIVIEPGVAVDEIKTLELLLWIRLEVREPPNRLGVDLDSLRRVVSHGGQVEPGDRVVALAVALEGDG
jgi:hypothetical protein